MFESEGDGDGWMATGGKALERRGSRGRGRSRDDGWVSRGVRACVGERQRGWLYLSRACVCVCVCVDVFVCVCFSRTDGTLASTRSRLQGRRSTLALMPPRLSSPSFTWTRIARRFLRARVATGTPMMPCKTSSKRHSVGFIK